MRFTARKKGNRKGAAFDSGGIEGMLDVMLGCTLVFMLMTALIKAGEGRSSEETLPSMNLSKTGQNLDSGTENTRELTISIKTPDAEPQVWIKEQKVPISQLPQQLKEVSVDGLTRVRLRRNTDVSCGIEDKIILACRQAGITNVSLVVETNSRGSPRK